MTLKEAVLKAVPLLLAACFAGGAVAAGQDSPGAETPKVDCKKTPAHPDCKKAN